MRHGSAEPDSPSGSDLDRVLTARGAAEVHEVAAAIAGHQAAPIQSILSSPATRALQTSAIVARALSLQPELRDELGPDAYPLTFLQALPKGTLVVGHQPWVSQVVRALAPQDAQARKVAFMPACAVLVDRTRGEVLQVVVPPT